MPVPLTPVIAATTHWLLTAYPAPGGVVSATLAQAQARQAVTVAAWLCYPTAMDAALVELVGPSGSRRLDSVVSGWPEVALNTTLDEGWRTWVDEVVASWAACLLGDHALASAAVSITSTTEHGSGLNYQFTRLLAPDRHDRSAAMLLRHQDFLAPVANLHRVQLIDRLFTETLDPRP